MLSNLAERRAFWRERHTAVFQGDSIATPFLGLENLFRGKKVLEIGPGEGRQFEVIFRYARTYAVADIVPEVLEQKRYAGVGRHLIRDYRTDDFGERFDLITFWYVVHHLRRQELDDFVGFLDRHLATPGILFFNLPGRLPPDLPEGSSQHRTVDDGMQTTDFRFETVSAALSRRHITCVGNAELSSNCHVVVAIK
jgi:SAM-dependent methyltransferase